MGEDGGSNGNGWRGEMGNKISERGGSHSMKQGYRPDYGSRSSVALEGLHTGQGKKKRA